MVKKYFIGVDEVGRGSWAGPLVFAAVCFLSKQNIPRSVIIRDSKTLGRPQRERSASFLKKQSTFCFCVVSTGTIDKIGIQKASIRGLRSVARKIRRIITKQNGVTEDEYKRRFCLMIDGRKLCRLMGNHQFIIRGDQTEMVISAASILAKVRRDAYMARSAKKYQYYGFDRNAGYGTAEHLNAIRKYGICDIHRRSYNPIKLYTGTAAKACYNK